MNNNLTEWSRNIVNTIMSMSNDYTYIYYLKFIFEPNPLNFDGIDNIMIQIMKKANNSNSVQKEEIFFQTGCCIILEEALKQTEEFIKIFTKKE